jgi:hypothetical protein
VTELFRFHSQPFFVVVSEDRVSKADLSIAEAASEYFPVVRAAPDTDLWLCEYAGVSVGDVLVFERRRRLFWVFHGPERTREGIGKWAADVANGKVQPETPGIGVFGWLFEADCERRASGYTRSPLPRPISMIILMTVVAVLADVVLHERRGSLSPQNRKRKVE